MGTVTGSGPWVLGYGCEIMGMGLDSWNLGPTWLQVLYISLRVIIGVFR